MSANDKGKIIIGGFFGHQVNPGIESTKILYFEFVNSGKRPIVMTNFGGRFKSGQYQDGLKAFIINVPGIPKKLEPGERHQVTFTEFDSIDDSVKSMSAYDTLGNGFKMSKKLLRKLKKEKKEFA